MSQQLMNELEEIQSQLETLQHRANVAIQRMPGYLYEQAKAYRVTDFGTSCNPYDTTFETVVSSFKRHMAEQIIEEDDEG